MSMRQHLQEHHTRTAETFAGIGKVLKDVMDGQEEGSPTHELCKALLDKVTPYAEHNLQCCKALSATGKAAGFGDVDLDALMPMPEGLSRVTPTSPGVTAVPRAGMRELPTPEQNPLYAKMYGTDEL